MAKTNLKQKVIATEKQALEMLADIALVELVKLHKDKDEKKKKKLYTNTK